MIDERNWKNKNCDRDQMNVDEKKRFENLEKNVLKILTRLAEESGRIGFF
jgi:hypothetical protein